MPKKQTNNKASLLAFIHAPDDLIGRNIQSLPIANDKIDEQIAKLQEELTREKDSRKEERFVWCFILIILFDVAFVLNYGFWCSLFIVLLEVIVLMVMAHMWGIEYAVKLLRPLHNKLMANIVPSDKK